MTDNAFLKSQNENQYTAHAGLLSEYTATEQFGIVEGIKPGDSILDIGCNNARLFNAAKEIHEGITYTGIDVDGRAIEMSRERFPESEFIVDAFPSKQLEGRHFDTVISYAVFIMFQDWRGSLKKIAEMADKRIVLDLAMTMDCPTVDDPELSYVYYLDSGQRVPYVVLNVIQLINFCFTEHVNAGEVRIMATNPETSSAQHGVPQEKFLRGIAIIEKDTTGKTLFGADRKSVV